MLEGLSVFLSLIANSLSEFYDVEFVLCKKEGILLKELSSKVNVYNLGNVRLANSFII